MRLAELEGPLGEEDGYTADARRIGGANGPAELKKLQIVRNCRSSRLAMKTPAPTSPRRLASLRVVLSRGTPSGGQATVASGGASEGVCLGQGPRPGVSNRPSPRSRRQAWGAVLALSLLAACKSSTVTTTPDPSTSVPSSSAAARRLEVGSARAVDDVPAHRWTPARDGPRLREQAGRGAPALVVRGRLPGGQGVMPGDADRMHAQGPAGRGLRGVLHGRQCHLSDAPDLAGLVDAIESKGFTWGMSDGS